MFLLLLIISSNIFFIDKAFNHDDHAYFIRAKQRFMFPGRPYCLPDLYDGKNYFSVYQCSHPPLIPIYLSIIMRFTGKMDEVTLHTAFLIFPMISAFFMYLLGHLVIKNGFLPALMLITSPTFMIMSTNIMTDVAMLAFCLATVYLFLSGIKRRNILYLFLSSLFHVFSLFTSYQSIFITFLLLIYLSSVPEYKFYPCLSILVPVIVFGVWCVTSKLNFGVFPVTVAANHLYHGYDIFNGRYMFIKLIYYLSMLGFLSIPPYLIIYLAFKEKREAKIFSILFLLISILFLLFLRVEHVDYTVFKKMCISSLCVISIFMLFKLIHSAIFNKNTYTMFIILWAIGFFVFANLIFSFGATRYLLPMFPALVFVFANFSLSDKIKVRRIGIFFCLLNFATGFMLTYSDYLCAYQYKKVAEDIRRDYSKVNRIWFSGEVNFRHYMEGIGGIYLLSNDNSPRKGDILVISKVMSYNEMSKELLKRISYMRDIYLRGGYVQIYNCTYSDSNASFYTHWMGRGLLPFEIVKNKEFDKITIYSIGD